MTSRAGLLPFVVLVTISPAAAAVGDWGQGLRAEVRLVAAGVDDDGKLIAGIEIVLPPRWKTYWRTPGDAGVPPLIDFSTSKNIGPADVAFPVPTRDDDGFSVSNVYHDRVVLPVSAVVTDRTKPVDLAVTMRLGVCEQVCVPEDVAVTLTVPPGENDTGAARILAAARALVPGKSEQGVFAIDSVVRDGGTDKRPTFRIVGMIPDAPHATVFVEGPNDWSAYTPEFVGEDGGKATYTVKFSRLGAKAPIDGAKFRITIVSGDRAIEQTIGLD